MLDLVCGDVGAQSCLVPGGEGGGGERMGLKLLSDFMSSRSATAETQTQLDSAGGGC